MLLQKVGLLGYGEVGSSIAEIYEQKNITLAINDPYKQKNDDVTNCDLLNICIPCYTKDKFMEIMDNVIRTNHPKLIVIHSSITPGITKELIEKYNLPIVHSPIRGVHPNLTKSIQTFAKFIGYEPNQDQYAKVVQQHFLELGLLPELVKNTINTEYMKLLSTTYYGVNIAFAAEVNEICQEKGLDFDFVYTRANGDYNDGYSKLGKPNVVRPVLFPLNSNEIGGHCVVENTILLKSLLANSSLDLKTLDIVLKYRGSK